jgi:peptidoglycan hydrolase-like protein with peptidoglycan-binding domain
MKKIAMMFLVVALAVALGACAFAEYVNKDGAKVYADWDTDSKVIARLSKGDKVTVLDVVDMQGKWNEVSIKVKGKKKTGFMLSKYLDENAPCKHKWGAWVIIDEPTCTETGYRQRQCVKCGILDDEVMPKTDHTYGKWKITREPTCTKEGQRVRTCKVCGHKQTKTIEKEPHDYGKWTVTQEPTCTAKGSRTRKCRVCGHKETQVMDKLPHDYGEWIVDKEASCTEEGMSHRTCQTCGHVQEKVIEKLPHDYKWEVVEKATDHSSGIRHQVCQVCGHTEPDVSYDPKGTLRRGDRGDDVRQVQQQLADQGYLTAKGVDGIFGGGMEKAIMQFQKDQNLTPDGVAWPQTIKRLNHDFGPWTLDKPLTRTSDGERVRVCKDCGLEQRETIKAGVIQSRDRGDNVRAIQKMLGDMGYNPGAYDGIYGAKLDIAYADFAAEHGVEFLPGSLWPGHVDALVNGWMAARSPENWKGEGDVSASVDLALTVTPVETDGDLVTYSWTLTNLGSQSCTFNALLLSYGDAPDFRQNTLTVAIDNITLKANRANSASGSFTVASGWGEGRLNFCAMAVVDKTGDVWNSNVVSY